MVKEELIMNTYVILGNYSTDAIENISGERKDKAIKIVEECGGSVQCLYALLGNIDLAGIVEFSDNESALKASVELARMSGISFTTYPAVDADRFDELVGK